VKFLFDTDHISLIQQANCPEYGAIQAHASAHGPSDIVFCIVSFQEQALGAHAHITRARTPADLLIGYRLMSTVQSTFMTKSVLPFDASALAEFDRLVASKVRVKTMDLRIAAIALANNLILVTRNSRDFSKVPGLVIEDWTR
jgi:tRNA(fMet)-specific endonuclease VapC